MQTSKIALFFASVILFTSCVKNDSTATGNVAFQLKALISPVQGASIVWTIGTASVTEVKLEAKKADNSEIEYKSNANVQVDLFAPVNLASVDIPKGTYTHLEFRSELASANNRAALRLEGLYTAGGVATPIVFEVGTPIELKAGKDSITITNASSYVGLTTLTFALLTQGITEADLKAADKPGGKIILSTSSNPGIYSKMLLNLDKCSAIEFH